MIVRKIMQQTVNKRVAQCWYERFCQGDATLECKEGCNRRSNIDNDQLRKMIEADVSNNTREISEELSFNHSIVLLYLKNMGKVNDTS